MTYISRRKEILGGAPVIAGTRIPIERVVWLYTHGYSEKKLHQEFPHVKIEKIRGALAESAQAGLPQLQGLHVR